MWGPGCVHVAISTSVPLASQFALCIRMKEELSGGHRQSLTAAQLPRSSLGRRAGVTFLVVVTFHKACPGSEGKRSPEYLRSL